MLRSLLFIAGFFFTIYGYGQNIHMNVHYVNKTNQPNNDTIYYNANKKLTWNDFKGTPDPNHFGGAVTASGFAYNADMEYEKIPCLGHPVFRNDAVNFDPREKVVYEYIKSQNKSNVFLDFYHELVWALKENGSMPRVMAVNVDALIACVWLSICWPHLRATLQIPR